MARGKFSKARKELIRAAKFNGKEIDAKLENLIVALNDKITDDKTKQQQERQMSSNKQLIIVQSSAGNKDYNHSNESIDRDSDSAGNSSNLGSRDDIIIVRQPANHNIDIKLGAKSDNQDSCYIIDNLDSAKDRIAGRSGGSSVSSRTSLSSATSSNVSSYRILCSNPRLVKDTIIIAFSSFSGHLFYYLLTINFADMKNLSIEANFISSGAGEWFSLVVGAILLRYLSRRTCMSICSFMMAASFIFQCLIDSDVAPELNTPIIVTVNNSVGTISSLLLVFVVLIVNQEVYPTVIRQTGSSIGNTLGELGSTLAPWLIQLNRSIGLWRADILCATICLTGMIGAQFLTKTDNVELEDV